MPVDRNIIKPGTAEGEVALWDHDGKRWVPVTPALIPTPVLDDLADVDTTGVSTGDTLSFNGTAWVAGKGGTFNVHDFGAVGDGETDDTESINDAIAAAVANGGGAVHFVARAYLVSSLVLDYSATLPDATAKGFRAPRLYGAGPRATILQQAVGATGPIIEVIGADSGNLHDGKVTGLVIQGFELRGIGTQPGIRLAIYQFGHLSDLWITGCSDGIYLDRPVKSATRDDMSHTIELQSIKSFQNSGWGLATSLVNSVGNVDAHNVECSYNTLGGYNISSNNFGLTMCDALGNLGPGFVATEPTDADSDAFGPFLFGFRAEGNVGDEIVIDGGVGPTLVGTITLASAGAHGITIGNGSNPTRNASIFGGRLIGNGPAGTGTVGQKALRIGSQSLGASVVNCGIETTRFADASATNNPVSVVTDTGNSSELRFFGAVQRSLLQSQRTAITDDAIDLRVFGDVQRHFRIRADGRQDWGDGAAAVDTNLYRASANVLTTDDRLRAVDGLTTKTKAGTPTDADFASTPADGTMVVDTTALKLWIRIASVWRQTVALT